MMSLFSITAAPLISVRLYKLTDKSVQTVYNHTDYARSYHENNSIHEEYPVGFIYYLSYCNKKDARLICVIKHRLLASYKINKYKLNPDS